MRYSDSAGYVICGRGAIKNKATSHGTNSDDARTGGADRGLAATVRSLRRAAAHRVEVPPRQRGQSLARLEVPVCHRHVDHWRRYPRLNGLAFMIGFAGIGLAALAAWWAFKPFDQPQRFPNNGLVAFLVLPWFGAFVALPFAVRLGHPVHVREASTNWITLAGLSSTFVAAWKSSPIWFGKTAPARRGRPENPHLRGVPFSA